MAVKDKIFRYRVITNLDCNMSPNCYFCYQPDKRKLRLDIEKARETMKKVGMLKRAMRNAVTSDKFQVLTRQERCR